MKTNKKPLKSFPFLLILLGIILLLNNFNIINDAWYKLWPLFIIIIGVVNIINYFIDE